MGSFGEKLKRERELRSVTLEEIADATKIGTRSLRALEQEQFAQLPGGIFNKGFVRAYANYLGIDAEQAVADFTAASGDAAKESDISEIAGQVERQRAQSPSPRGPSVSSMLVLVVFLVIIFSVIGGLRYWGTIRAKQTPVKASPAPVIAAPITQTPAPQTSENTTVQKSEDNQSSQPDTTPAVNTTSPAPEKVLPTTTSTAAPKPDNAQDAVTVKVRALGPAWISVSTDGKRVFQDMMYPNRENKREKTFSSHERLRLIVGDPAKIEVTYNGKILEPLGPEGQRQEVVFTPEGIQR